MTETAISSDEQLVYLVHATRKLGRTGYERVELRYIHVGNYVEACVVSVVDGEELLDPMPDDLVMQLLQRRLAQRDESGAWVEFVLACWSDGLVEESGAYDDEPVWLVGHPTEHDLAVERERFPRSNGFPLWATGGQLAEPRVPEARDLFALGDVKARALRATVGDDIMRHYHEALVRSLEVQEHVMSLVGDAEFELDLTEAGTVRFTGATGDILARAHVLGAATFDARSEGAPGAGEREPGERELGERDAGAAPSVGTPASTNTTWNWSWSDDDEFTGLAPSVRAASQWVREFGEAHQLNSFTAPTLPLAQVLQPRATTMLFVVAAKPVAGAWSHFTHVAESGAEVALLLEHEAFDVRRVGLDIAAQYALAAALHFSVDDHEALIVGYAKHARGVEVFSRDGGWGWRAPEGEVHFDIDDQSKLSQAYFLASPDTEPLPLFADPGSITQPVETDGQARAARSSAIASPGTARGRVAKRPKLRWLKRRNA